jgi:hypothetical protein
MQFAASYEIKTECSVVTDDLILRINHPRGTYRARIKNIPRAVYTTPFLLSLHLYFEAPSLNAAREVADAHLVDCMNMLAFTTGSGFQRHRIRQVVEISPGPPMTNVLMWSDEIEYEDPQPFLDENIARSIERLSEFEVPPAVRRAMRWYRFGVNAQSPDDQFTYFWFALELVAEFQKSTEKVPDACPICRSPLYCETCRSQPTHRPYAKQAIRELLKAVDKDCDDATVDRLDKTRNSLMHGATLKEVEGSLPEPHEEIVDVLGRLLWRALVHQFPREMFDGTLSMGAPSTYVHRTLHAVAHIQTVVPRDADGDLDLNFKGTTSSIVPFGPPQSARPFMIRMSMEQQKRLARLGYAKGDQSEMCLRVYQKSQEKDGHVYAVVLATDMALIQEAVKRGDTGAWQELFREILAPAAGPTPAHPTSSAT